MIESYVQLNRTLRNILRRSWDAHELASSNSSTSERIAEHICLDTRDLKRLWPSHVSESYVHRIERLAKENSAKSFREIVAEAIPDAADAIDEYFAAQPVGGLANTILELLHPVVIEASYSLFRSEHNREAAFNAVKAVFDLIRTRTGRKTDGVDLLNEVLAFKAPLLILADLEDKSGRSEQRGLRMLIEGIWAAVRNPSAHTSRAPLSSFAAAQYLVLASLLARRVESGDVAMGTDNGSS